MIFRHVVIGFLLGCLATGARADLAEADLTFFVEESSARYGEASPDRIDIVMYEIAENATGLNDFLADFAARLDVSEDQARRYAEALISVTRFEETCESSDLPDSCRFAKGTELYTALTETGFADETGRVAMAIGREVSGLGDWDGRNSTAFLQAIADHPAYEDILIEILRYNNDPIWHEALVVRGSQHPKAHQMAIANWQRLFEDTPDIRMGARAAWFERAADEARLAGEVENAINSRQALLRTLLQNGLTEEALSIFDALPPEERTGFFTVPVSNPSATADEQKLRRRLTASVYELGLELVAAKIYTDGPAAPGADALFRDVRAMETAGLEQTSKSRALQDILERQLAPDDLFDQYLYGLAAEGDKPAYLVANALLEESGWQARERLSGWRFALRTSGPHFLWVAAERLEKAGLGDIAAHSRADVRFERSIRAERLPGIETLSALLPDGHHDRAAYWQGLIDAARTDWESKRDTAAIAEAAASHVMESEVPIIYQASGGTDGACGPEADPETLELPSDLPVNPGQVVRYEQSGDTRAIVYVSGQLDRPGEIPAWGYFVQFDHGTQGWDRPHYLGLQMHFPYVLRPDSQYTMLTGDGHLMLEADLAEIDMATVTFPPVDLGLKRERCGVMLDFDLELVAQDSDGDWITDLAEARMGMNPNNTDSDGDGIADGFDSLPLTAYDPTTPRGSSEVAFALLEAVMGIERQAIMVGVDDGPSLPSLPGTGVPPVTQTAFLVADPEIFAGVMLPFRLLVYRPGDLGKLGRGDTPFYPPEVSAIFTKPDGSEIYVIWSATWTGGTFLVRCSSEIDCEQIVLEEWVT